MNAKLFVVMGVTWTMEIVSSFATDPPWIWYLVDAANALQRAPILCIFVLKPKVIRTLAHRLGSLTSDPTQDPTPLNNLPNVTTHIVGGRHPAIRHSAQPSQPSQTADMAECCQGLANNVGSVLNSGYPDFENIQTCELRLQCWPSSELYRTLCHPTAFGVVMWNCCGYEQHTRCHCTHFTVVLPYTWHFDITQFASCEFCNFWTGKSQSQPPTLLDMLLGIQQGFISQDNEMYSLVVWWTG